MPLTETVGVRNRLLLLLSSLEFCLNAKSKLGYLWLSQQNAFLANTEPQGSILVQQKLGMVMRACNLSTQDAET